MQRHLPLGRFQSSGKSRGVLPGEAWVLSRDVLRTGESREQKEASFSLHQQLVMWQQPQHLQMSFRQPGKLPWNCSVTVSSSHPLFSAFLWSFWITLWALGGPVRPPSEARVLLPEGKPRNVFAMTPSPPLHPHSHYVTCRKVHIWWLYNSMNFHTSKYAEGGIPRAGKRTTPQKVTTLPLQA